MDGRPPLATLPTVNPASDKVRERPGKYRSRARESSARVVVPTATKLERIGVQPELECTFPRPARELRVRLK